MPDLIVIMHIQKHFERHINLSLYEILHNYLNEIIQIIYVYVDMVLQFYHYQDEFQKESDEYKVREFRFLLML
jgi:hypothetical protein